MEFFLTTRFDIIAREYSLFKIRATMAIFFK